MLNFLLQHSPLLYFVQSFWRDEAFSVLVAERPISMYFTKLTFEPPLYYLMLHYWIKIFGNSEIAARSLSLLGLTLATVLVIHWAEKIFPKSWLSWFLPLFFFTNPMLLYYGFEVRTYGWYIFFITLSMYAYLSKKWKLFITSTSLGFYTHTFFMINFAVTVLHYTLYNRKRLFEHPKLSTFWSDPMIRSSLIALLIMLPWITRVIHLSSKLAYSWYFPVDFHLVGSVLGNMFLGYEGTPWYLWKYTAWLSLFLLVLFIKAIVSGKSRKFNMFFFIQIFVPLMLVIGISFIKPLFVNRYLISVTIAEIILLTLALAAIKNKAIQISMGLILILGTSWFNLWYPDKHAKFPYRQTMAIVNATRQNRDYIYATSSLNYFETLYYAKNRNGVLLHNTSGYRFPWYVGDAIFDQKQMVYKLPTYPYRALLVTPEGKISISYDLHTISKP